MNDISVDYNKLIIFKPTVDADDGIKYTVNKKGRSTETVFYNITVEFGNTIKDERKVNVSS